MLEFIRFVKFRAAFVRRCVNPMGVGVKRDTRAGTNLGYLGINFIESRDDSRARVHMLRGCPKGFFDASGPPWWWWWWWSFAPSLTPVRSKELEERNTFLFPN